MPYIIKGLNCINIDTFVHVEEGNNMLVFFKYFMLRAMQNPCNT